MIAQSTGVDWWWHKAMPQGIHLDQGSHPDHITKIIGIKPFGHAGAALWLTANNAHVGLFTANLVSNPGEELPGEV
jgi:hypothetical protein